VKKSPNSHTLILSREGENPQVLAKKQGKFMLFKVFIVSNENQS